MSFFEAQIDEQADLGYAHSAEERGNGEFPPLPAGWYPMVVVENKGVEELTDDTTNRNFGKKVVRLQVRIVAESPTGANRSFFHRLPLFSRWAPNPHSSNEISRRDGWPVDEFWHFFEKVMGMSLDEIKTGKMRSDVEGKFLMVKLGKPKAPDEHNPLGSNEIEDFAAPSSDFSKVPRINPNVPVAAWLTAEGTLNPAWTPPVKGGQTGGYTPGGGAATGGYVPGGGAQTGGYQPGGAAQAAYNPAAAAAAQQQAQLAAQQAQLAAQQQAAQLAAQQGVPAGYSAGPNFPGHVVPNEAAAPGFGPGAPGFGPGAAPAAPQVNIPDGVPPEWAGAQTAGTAAGTGYGL